MERIKENIMKEHKRNEEGFITDIAEPKQYIFFTVHTTDGKDLKGIGFIFDDTESILEFITKLRETEVSFWL